MVIQGRTESSKQTNHVPQRAKMLNAYFSCTKDKNIGVN